MKPLPRENFERLNKLQQAFEKLLQLFSKPIQQEIEDILNEET